MRKEDGIPGLIQGCTWKPIDAYFGGKEMSWIYIDDL